MKPPNALAQDVQRFMRNDPVDAMKPSLGYHFKKFAKRHRSAIATVAAFAMVLVLGTVVSVGQAIRAKREESKAQQSYQEAVDAKLQAKGAEETERVLREEAESNAYTANMRLSQSDWENGNYTRIYDILNRQRDYARKGFEWGYWQRTLHLETSRFLTHAGGIRLINVSAQGDRAALVMADGTIEVRSTPDGHEIVKIAGHPHWARKAIFSPDGTMIASTGGELFSGRVTLWNATTGEEIRFMGAPGEGGAGSTEPGFIGYRQYALAFSPDGRWLATGGAHSRFGIQLWDVATRNRVGSLGEDWVGRPWINDLAFTKDGSHLLCRAGLAPYLALYDVETSKRLASIGTPEAREWVTAMSLLPQSNMLAVTLEEEIVVYDLAEDNFSNPRNTLTELPRHRGAIFSPNEKWLVLRSGADALVHEANSGNYVKTIHGAGACTTFLPESDQMLSASKRWLKLWDVEAYQLAKVINARHPIVALAKDGSEAMVLREDADPVDSAIVDLATGQVKAPLSALAPVGGHIKLEGTRYGIDGAAFSPDGRLVAYGARDGTIRVFDTNGAPLTEISTPSTAAGRSVEHSQLAFGLSGKTVISVDDHNDNKSIALWDVSTGKMEFRTEDLADTFAITHDETLLASAHGEIVTLWDVASGEQLLPPWKALDRGEFQNTGPGRHLIGYRFEHQGEICVRVVDFGGVELRA